MTDSTQPDAKAKRPKARAEQVVLDHDLPPYTPKVGDIVIAFHLFKEPAEMQEDLKRARESGQDPATFIAQSREPVAKFRPMLVMAARDGRALLVPISSSPEPRGRHMAMSEPAELAAAGLADHKSSYVKVLEAAQYDFPHPLVLPVTGADGQPTWQAGEASKLMRGQVALEMRRQKEAGRLATFKDRSAAHVPAAIVTEMARATDEARAKRAPVRKAATAVNDPTRDAAVPYGELDRRKAALMAHMRAERVREATEALARRNGEHPDQVAVAHANATDVALRRGTHPDQQVVVSEKAADRGASK
ncbi:hypothetical protein ACOI1H_13545 [Loktanella sp. DJP18]|uniref:hypothetical protein n=1 Tax=Loktanella sp. DJP18 TaxID=3409788 RepID=UPI003BB5A685